VARNLLILSLALALAGCGSFRNLDELEYDDGDTTVAADTAGDADTGTDPAPDLPPDTADDAGTDPDTTEEPDLPADADAEMDADGGDTDLSDADTGDADTGDADMDSSDLGDDVEPDAEPCTDCPKLHGGPTATSICASKDGTLYCWGDNSNLQLADPERELVVRFPQRVSGIGDVNFVSGGGRHGCAITADAELWCWGANGTSQLGRPGPDSSAPQQVLNGVTTVATGEGHTCAHSADGLQCWGDNTRGQTGEPRSPSEDPVPTPARVTEGPSLVQLAGGASFSCATTTDTSVICWGDNTGGQIGVSPNETRCPGPDFGSCTSADYVVGLTGLPHSVSTGREHACASTTTGVFCWGRNDQFQTSPNGGADTHVPAEVITPDGFDLMLPTASGADHNCGITLEGTAVCWGVNVQGRAGQPTEITAVRDPAQVPLATPIRQVTAGWRHTCALRAEGEAYCWGDGPQGQIGVGFILPGPTPQPVDLPGVQQISAGGEFTCAVRDDQLYCWGDNKFGQMGDGVPLQRAAPFTVPTQLQFESVHTGARHVCGRTSAGTMYCWGNNLGLGFGIDANPWTSQPATSGIRGALSVAVGYDFTCAVDDGDTLYCWGQNACGQTGQPGNGFTERSPVEVSGGWRSVAAGQFHACAVAASGAVSCWGGNEYGQVGAGGGVFACGQNSVFKTPTPTPVANARSVSLGSWHSCAVNNDDEVLCWGRADSGQLGRPVIPEQGWSREPVRVDVANVVQVAAGEDHTCARTRAGKVWCWGSTAGGRMGAQPDDLGCDGRCQLSPLEVDRLDDVIDIAVTASSTCASLRNGEVHCWGQNHKGQLGIGSFDSQAAPHIVDLQ
jgi:alpha-tubulin suppressor-like RCC1 family protein